MPDSMMKRIEELATADGEDRKIIFTIRAGAEITGIKLSDEYEDWPADSNLIGVALQMAQDHQETVNSYVVDNKDNDFEPAQESSTETDPEL
eukprot:14667813-Ditylum_brightwellii.AAC.1